MATDGILIDLIYNFDDAQLKNSLGEADKTITSGFNSIFDKLKKNSVFSLNTKELDQSIKDIESKVKKLNDTKTQLELRVPTEDTKKQIGEIEKRLGTLTAERQIKIDVSKASKTSLNSIEKQIKSLNDKKNEIILDVDYKNAKADIDKIERELDDLERVRNIKINVDKKKLGQLKSALDSIGRVGVAAAAALGVALTSATIAMYSFGSAASNAVETNNKLINVFSNLDKAMVTTSVNDLVKNYGQAKSSAEGLLAATGDLLVGLGTSEKQALGLSLQVQKLAVDLASFQNIGVEQASGALTALMLGERERAKSLGIIINEEMVKVELQKKGMQDLTGLARQQAEAQISLMLAMQQTMKAQGDYARTSGDLANQQRLVGENTKTLQETFGMLLLPALKELTTYLNEAITDFTTMLETNEELRGSIEKMGTAIAEFGKELIDGVVDVLPTVIKAFTWIIDNTDLIIAVIAGLAAIFVTLKIVILATTGAFVAFNIATGGILIAIGLLVTGLALLALNYEKMPEVMKLTTDEMKEQAIATQNTATALENQIVSSTNLAARYEELAAQSKHTREEQEEMETIMLELEKLYPDLDVVIYENGKAVGINTEALKLQNLEKSKNILLSIEQAKQDKKDIEGLIKKAEIRKDDALKAMQGMAGDAEMTAASEKYSQANRDLEDYAIRLGIADKALEGLGDTEERVNAIMGLTVPDSNTTTTKAAAADKKNAAAARKTAADRLRDLEKEYITRDKFVDLEIASEQEKNDKKTALDKKYLDDKKRLLEMEAIAVEQAGGSIENTMIAHKTIALRLKETAKEYEDFYNRLDLETQASVQKRLDEENRLYTDTVNQINNTVDDEKEKNELIEKETKRSEDAKLKIISDAQSKYTAAGGEAESYGAIEVTTVEINEEGDIDETTQSIDELNKSLGETPDAVEEALSALEEWLKENKDTMESIADYASQIGNAIVDIFGNALAIQTRDLDIEYEKQSKIRDEKYADDQDALDEKHEREQEAYADQLEALDEMREEHQEELDEINEELDELEAEKKEIMREEDYLDLQRKIEEKQEEADEKKNILDKIETDEEALKDQVENSEDLHRKSKEAAETAYTLAKEKRDQDYAIKKAELERKQAIASKSMALFDATVAMVLSQITLFPNFLLMGLAAAAGIAAIAVIGSTPLPQIPAFAMGGFIGSEHEGNYKGLGFTPPNNQDNTLAWLTTGERVLTLDQNKAYESMLAHDTYSNSNYGNTSNSEVINNYSVNVSVPNSNASPHTIAKAVVKAIGGRI